jgi:hypothetical protein
VPLPTSARSSASPENLPATYYNRGVARSDKQDVELAMADFAKAWELLPNTLSSEDVQ